LTTKKTVSKKKRSTKSQNTSTPPPKLLYPLSSKKLGIVMSSPSTGYVRIKLDFNDGFNSGEFITISYILATSEGDHTHHLRITLGIIF